MFPNSLPKNWKREEKLREGIGMGKLVQTIYWSPEGKKITSKRELMTELGAEWDAPECFDFKTGMYSSELLKKKQDREKRKNDYFLKMGHRPIDYDFDLPSRRAQWCGEMPLKIIRPYPANKIEKEYPAREREEGTRPIAPVRQRPSQLLSEKRLQNIKPCEVDGFQAGNMSLPESIKPCIPEIFDDGALLSRMSSQLLSSKLPLQGQKDSEVKETHEKDGEKDLYKALLSSDHVQPMCKMVKITDEEILQQEDKVCRTQKALADLMRKYRAQQENIKG